MQKAIQHFAKSALICALLFLTFNVKSQSHAVVLDSVKADGINTTLTAYVHQVVPAVSQTGYCGSLLTTPSDTGFSFPLSDGGSPPDQAMSGSTYTINYHVHTYVYADSVRVGATYLIRGYGFYLPGGPNNYANSNTLSITVVPGIIYTVYPTPPVVPDNTPPTATLARYDSTDVSYTVSFTGADNIAVDSFELSKNGVFVAMVSATATTYTYTGLNASTVYFFSLRAKDAANNYSGVQSLYGQTKPTPVVPDNTPPTAITFTAFDSTNTSFTVNFSATDSSGINLFELSLNGNFVINLNSFASSYIYTGLNASTMYLFSLRVQDGAGNWSTPIPLYGQTKPNPDFIAPTGNLFATDSTTNSITVGFNGVDIGSGVDSFQLSLNNTVVTTLGSTANAYVYSGLNPYTTYLLTLRVRDVAGNWSQPILLYVKTKQVPDVTPPTSMLSRYDSTDVSYTVTFSGADNVGVDSFELSINGIPVAMLSSSNWMYTYTGLTASTVYFFSLRSKDAAGNWSAIQSLYGRTKPSPVQPDVTPPTSITFTAYDSTNTSFTVHFAAADSSGISTFELSVNGSFVINLNSFASSYIYTSLSANTMYLFSLRVQDGAGNWSPIQSLYGQTKPDPDNVLPTGNFAATDSSINSITVAFSGVDAGSGVDSFQLSLNNNVVTTLGSTASTYVYTGLSPYTLYPLTLKVRDVAGNWSSPISLYVRTKQVPDLTPPTATLSRYDSTDVSYTVTFSGADNVGVDVFELFLNGNVVTTLPSTATSYTFTGLTASTTYLVGLRAKDMAGNWSIPISLYAHTKPAPVQQAVALSMELTFCFIPVDEGGGYVWVDLYGSNFVDGGTFTAYYYYQGVPDGSPYIGNVWYLSPTHIRVQVWISYLYTIYFTVTNPGGLPSNEIQTQIVDCGWTGIAKTEMTRDGRFSFTALGANPVVNSYSFELNKDVENPYACSYQISNTLGQIVKSGELSANGNNSISFSDVVSGLYILTIYTETPEGKKVGITKKLTKL